tara:strand:+ start:164 stop:640 length:477 start_codon:yes stop_codon:yes gene_type:complete
MSFTRFHDDPARIQKTNLETSSINNYIFNVPGNTGGVNVPYIEDPHIRIQKGGASTHTNMVGVESMLRNLYTPINRDSVDYKKKVVSSKALRPSNISNTITSETRATHPVFEYRETNTYRPHVLLEDPQQHVFIPFNNNLDTNILEKDHYNLNTLKKI